MCLSRLFKLNLNQTSSQTLLAVRLTSALKSADLAENASIQPLIQRFRLLTIPKKDQVQIAFVVRKEGPFDFAT